MPNAESTPAATRRHYLIGFALAAVLTAVPFAFVTSALPSKTLTLAVIVAAAVLQVLVHLRFFLHLTFSPRDPWRTLAIAFTAVILFIMIGGTLWILFDLNGQMMYAATP